MTTPALPSTCRFCGKQKTAVRNLMIGLVLRREGEAFPSSICDECLGVLMTVVAHLDRRLFERLVDAARAYKPGSEPPEIPH